MCENSIISCTVQGGYILLHTLPSCALTVYFGNKSFCPKEDGLKSLIVLNN